MSMSAATTEPTPYAQAAGPLVLNGWWPLPLPARSKKSPPEGYTGATGRQPSADDLTAWIRDRAAGNVAVRLPPDVVGIDVDAYGDKPGWDTFGQLQQQYGDLPPTVVVSSREDGRSGIRLYRLPDGADQSTFRTGWAGIEILRHGHRYVVAPPSIHPDTGQPYRCTDEATGEQLQALPPKATLPELPVAWLLACHKPVHERQPAAPAPTTSTYTGERHAPCKAMAAALDRVMAEHDAGGSRHDAATAGALALLRLGDFGHHGIDYALDILGRHHVNAITDRVPRGTAMLEWQSIVDTARAKVAERPTPAHEKGCCGADSLAARQEAQAVDWLAQLEHGEPRYEIVDGAPVLVDDAPEPLEDRIAEAKRLFVEQRLPILDWHALWADDSEEEWIVEPLLPARRLVALYSAPKVGKSLLLLELAAGIACGGRWLLDSRVEAGRRVLYVDFENDPRADVRERLQNMGYGPDDLGNLRYLSFPTLGGLDSERGAEELMAAVEYHQAEVVVIDTVSRAVAGEENENDTWLSFYRHTGLRLKQAGVSLIRLDHAGKDETKGQRGGSAKVGDVDAVWRMSKVTDTTFRLQCEANRMPLAPEQKDLTLIRHEEPLLRHAVAANGWKLRMDEVDALLAPLRIGDADLTQRRVLALAKEAGVEVSRSLVRSWVDREKGRRNRADEAS